MAETNEELAGLMESVRETQEQIAKTLAALNSAPNVATPVTRSIEDQATQPTRKFLTPEERLELSVTLRHKSTQEIMALLSLQANKGEQGIPLHAWLNQSGYSAQQTFEGISGQLDPDVRKALDTGGATALIRQDLEPMLYELFVRIFPAYDRFPKEPANGLVHAWNQITAYGDAQFMGELGTVTDDVSTYQRQTTNVAILATRRGISLKSQFAVMAGGMNYNPEQLELQGGLRAIAHKMQKTIFGGQASDSGGQASNELGLYDANGFTGLRATLNTGRVKNVDPASSPDTTGNIRRAIDAAVVEIVQQGGALPSIIWSNPAEKNTFNEQQDDKTRIVVPNNVNIGVGVTASEVNTVAGPLPWAIVPGDSIGSYTATTYSSNTVRDLYLLDESTITLPFLGSPGPTVLDIPIGISGQLTHLYIVFVMNGLAVKAIPFSNKVRVKVA